MHKSRGSLLYPFTCARTVRAAPAAIPSGAEEAKARDNQGNAMTRNTGDKEGKVDSLSKILAEAASAAPARALSGQPARCQRREPPLSPRVPNAVNNYIGTRGREAPLWWDAALCQDHKHMVR